MWENYGQDGICIGFDTSGMNVHQITYSDAPMDAGYIRDKLMTVCERIGHGNLDNVGKEFTAILNLVASMGLLNLYRKDC